MTELPTDRPGSKAAMARLRNEVRSATFAVPRLIRLFPEARSALQVGCGSAAWLTMLERHGVTEILGVDGTRHPQLHIPPDRFRELDLARRFTLDRTFDLTLSLNAAEHLPPDRAPGFVADLCATSGVVIFGAAVPGEGRGVHERWPSYWARLFAGQGFDCVDCLRPLVWADARVDWRCSQSLLCFVEAGRLPGRLPGLSGLATVPPAMLDLVHPLAELKPPDR